MNTEMNPSLSIALLWDVDPQTPAGMLTGRLLLTDGAITYAALEAQHGSLQPSATYSRKPRHGTKFEDGGGHFLVHELEPKKDGAFSFSTGAAARLSLTITGARLEPGAHASLLTVETGSRSFSFFLRDVTRACPLYAPHLAAAVTTGDDPRSFGEIAEDVRRLGLATRLQRLEQEPEESFESAAAAVRRQPNCPTWLGLGRDFRSFQVSFRQDGEAWDWIQPQYHAHPVELPENDNRPVRYNFFIGRGIGCTQPLHRWLDDGTLPILHAELDDGDIRYHATAFTSLEYRPLLNPASGAANLRGTHYLVADHYGYGNMQTAEQSAECDRLMPAELDRDEETVLYLRVEASNTAAVPRSAWLKAPAPNAFHVGTTQPVAYTFDAGFSRYTDAPAGEARIFLVASLNGSPLPQEEIALLLQPGETAVFDLFLPHRPLSLARASALAGQDFNTRLTEVQRFWCGRLASAARVQLPDAQINAMLHAGLLHLDLLAYGLEPDGVVAPCIGVYCPIGSESSPIIQFIDSMGWSNLAARALEYFIAKQHEDGFMQNFGGYMLETGAALWSLGEHYRLTGDDAWAQRIAPHLIKACDYLLRWSERNRLPAQQGCGYGLLDGKVADPEDPYHIFMLNGYAYLGITRTAEMLAQASPSESARLASAAGELKALIHTALEQAAARSPLVPLGDGTWIPSLPPWAEYRGPVSLFADGGSWFTHGAFVSRDSLVGPLYLVFQEVLDPGEPLAEWLLQTHAELFTVRNVAFSQPYYSPQPWVHLRRGEVKPFLKAYYNTVAALADRETGTFWEHFHLVSPHKTHEEAWFLMQTRWMLYLEELAPTGRRCLRLLPGIPRAWLADGKRIEFSGMRSAFGALQVSVESHLNQGYIRASVAVTSHDRRPERVLLRLPHPEGKPARACRGGSYNPTTECVTIDPWTGSAEVLLQF